MVTNSLSIETSRESPVAEPYKTSFVVGLCLALTVIIVGATPVSAEVPHDVTYTGKLIDGSGGPVAGPVNLELRIFDSDAGGNQLYSEEHLGVPTDAAGAFSVQLGLGTNPVGTFDAALFTDVNRFLEVVIGAEVLTPRQIVGSVPWALVAERANELVRDPNAPRFEDCGDGTVADHRTGLQWEKKTGVIGATIICDCSGQGICPPVDCSDANTVNHLLGSSEPGVFPLNILRYRLNGEFDPLADAGCFANSCDWRAPSIPELQSILIGPDAAPGQVDTCTSAPCIDSDFAAVGGPTALSVYWSTSSYYDSDLSDESFLWTADFASGTIVPSAGNGPRHEAFLRMVRTGSCN